MPDIHVSSDEIREIEDMLRSSAFQKLMQVSESDYQIKWQAAATIEERENIWHQLKGLQHVWQKLHDLVGGFKLQRKALDARARPSDASYLKPPGVVDPLPFQE
jgi:DNA-binding protein H-NS